MRLRQPFVIDVRSMRVICPWSPKRPLPGDEQRLDALLERLDPDALPAAVCWCWGRPGSAAGLAAWARDRAVYRLAA